MENPEKVMGFLTEAENAAESVLADRAQIIELDRTRNKLREASRVVRKMPDQKVWVCVAGTFVKMPSQTIQKVMKGDLDELDTDIGKLRVGLKKKVDKLRDVENKEELCGFNLNPLSKEEISAIENIL